MPNSTYVYSSTFDSTNQSHDTFISQSDGSKVFEYFAASGKAISTQGFVASVRGECPNREHEDKRNRKFIGSLTTDGRFIHFCHDPTCSVQERVEAIYLLTGIQLPSGEGSSGHMERVKYMAPYAVFKGRNAGNLYALLAAHIREMMKAGQDEYYAGCRQLAEGVLTKFQVSRLNRILFKAGWLEIIRKGNAFRPTLWRMQVGQTNQHYTPITINDLFLTDSAIGREVLKSHGCFATDSSGDGRVGRLLNHSHNRVYSLLKYSGPLSQGELSERLGISQPVISTLLTDLMQLKVPMIRSIYREQTVADPNKYNTRYYSVAEPLPKDDLITRHQRQHHLQERKEHFLNLRDKGELERDGDVIRYIPTGQEIPARHFEFIQEIFPPVAQPVLSPQAIEPQILPMESDLLSEQVRCEATAEPWGLIYPQPAYTTAPPKKKKKSRIPESDDEWLVFKSTQFRYIRRARAPESALFQFWFEFTGADWIPNSVHYYDRRWDYLKVKRWWYEKYRLPLERLYTENREEIEAGLAAKRHERYEKRHERYENWLANADKREKAEARRELALAKLFREDPIDPEDTENFEYFQRMAQEELTTPTSM